MDVQLPDGTVIQGIPDDMSKADLTAKLAANGYDVSKLGGPSPAAPAAPAATGVSDEDVNNYIAEQQKQKVIAQGKESAQQRMAAPDEYVDVPVMSPDGAFTGQTERVLKPKADPIGMGAMETIPFAKDLAAYSRSTDFKIPFTDTVLKGSGRTMSEEKNLMAGESQANLEAYPGAYRIGEAAGIVPQLYAPMGLASKGTTFLGKTGLGALEGAGYAGAAGLGEGTTMEERLANAKSGAITGGLLGGALGRFAGEAAPIAAPQVSDAVAAAERLGVDLPRYATTDSSILQSMTPVAGAIPGAKGPIIAARETATKQLGDAVDALVPRSATPEQAGQSIGEGLTDWITKGSKEDADKAYDEVRNLFDKPDALTPLDNTRNAIADIMARRGQAKLSDIPPAIDMLLPAVQTAEGVTYDGAKTLYTELRKLKSQNLVQGVDNANVNKLYEALNKDVMTAAENAGGEPAAFFLKKADTQYAQDSEVRKQLQKIVGADGNAPDEQVFSRLLNAAKTGGSANNALVQQAITVMNPAQLKMFQAGILSKLGRDVNGNFSPDRWLGAQGIAGLSSRAKAMIFKDEPELVKALDDVTTVSQRFKDLNKYGNPSGTAQVATGTGMLGGLFVEPISVLSTLAGANAFSRIMSKPETAKSAADWARRYETYVRNPSYVTGRNVYRSGVTLNHVLSSEAGKPVDVNAHLNIQPPTPNP